MTLIELSEQGLTDDEIIQFAIDELNISEMDARFMLAVERGEVGGDIIVVDVDGNESYEEGKYTLLEMAGGSVSDDIQRPPEGELRPEQESENE